MTDPGTNYYNLIIRERISSWRAALSGLCYLWNFKCRLFILERPVLTIAIIRVIQSALRGRPGYISLQLLFRS